MPGRAYNRVAHHIRSHPYRLAATVLVISGIAWGLAIWALVATFDAGHRGRVDNCVAINELSRKIYVTLYDAGLERHEIRKFIPSQHCEDIP